MLTATRKALAQVAEAQALKPFHGEIEGSESNIAPLIAYFPKWNIKAADGMWCAAFVYYCCRLAGFEIPYSPDECVNCSLAGCGGWDEYAQADKRLEYRKGSEEFSPLPGDIVIFDKVFSGVEHDHIGIVLKATEAEIITAEGNINNRSCIMTRRHDAHIRAYVRIPDGYAYQSPFTPLSVVFSQK